MKVRLHGLKGMNVKEVEAVWIGNTRNFEKRLSETNVLTSAGDKGSFNIWRTKAGVLRGCLMKWCVRMEDCRFESVEDAKAQTKKWLRQIK